MAEPQTITSFTLDDLKDIMRTCAGVDESVDLGSDIGDRAFEDLGYDSLAVLQMYSKIQNSLGFAIPDDAAQELTTPQSLVDYVATRLTDYHAAVHQAAIGR